MVRYTVLYNLLLPLTLLLSASTAALTFASTEDPSPAEEAINASAVAATQSTAPVAAPANPGSRDQLLYENHCTGCHESQAYIREQRKARSLDDIREWVQRWSSELHLDWGAQEIEIVTRYLNRRFYHFDEHFDNDTKSPSTDR